MPIPTTNYEIEKPIAGEGDLAGNVADAYDIIDGIMKGNADNITSLQEQLDNLEDDLTNRVETLEADLHNQENPPYADQWHKHAYADTAGKLVPGTTINGKSFDGSFPLTLDIDDLDGGNRTYYGTLEPSQVTFEKPLRNGDIYVQVYR